MKHVCAIFAIAALLILIGIGARSGEKDLPAAVAVPEEAVVETKMINGIEYIQMPVQLKFANSDTWYGVTWSIRRSVLDDLHDIQQIPRQPGGPDAH